MARHDAAEGTVAMPSASRMERDQGGPRATQNMIALPIEEVQHSFRSLPRHGPNMLIRFTRSQGSRPVAPACLTAVTFAVPARNPSCTVRS